jgi:phosphoglycolate phosphatase
VPLEVNLIVFDWDGTLIDSKGHIVRAMQAAFVAQSLPAPAESDVCDIIGLGLGVAVQRLGRHLSQSRQQAVAAAYRAFYLQQEDSPPVPFAGVGETLAALRAAGFRLAVATGKSRRGLTRSMDENGLTAYFDATRCSDEAPSKPDPRMLQDIMLDLDAQPHETLMVGDTEHDLLMARAAGTHAAGVCFGVLPRERLRALTPAFLLEDIRELPARLHCMPGRPAEPTTG